ncbi:MAG: hypothetical protein M3186_04700 [Actinomycetota bacterium]|nr:hypothetical protein [Actinomycetota bacterium]
MLAGMARFGDIRSDVAQPPQCVGFRLPGLAVLTNAPLKLAQTPQRFDFTAPVIQMPVDRQAWP